MYVRKRFHTIIYVPLKGFLGVKVPVILLPDGTRFFEALHWTLERQRQCFSSATLKKQNVALGNFIDLFYFRGGTGVLSIKNLSSLLFEFRNYRLNGHREMGWAPISPRTAEHEVEYISSFYDYCADAFGYNPINAREERSYSALPYVEKLRYSKRIACTNKGLLGYLRKNSGRHITKMVSSRKSKSFPGSPKDAQSFKTFPPEKASALIEDCHSIRDVLMFILLFYGGVRSSEVCHLFVQDIEPLPDPTSGQAVVSLVHPAFGWITYNRKSDGKLIVNAKRQHYLEEEFRISPRNLLPINNSMHAGWKGMTYEERGYRTRVYWSRPDMGIMFYKLHKRYMLIRAKTGEHHPYYFINVDPSRSGEKYGHPLKLNGLRKRFYDACRRIGLMPGKNNGVNPHGARHFYGFFLANVLRLSKDTAQRFFRHASNDSTAVYYNLSISVAREELIKAYELARLNNSGVLLSPILIKAGEPGE